MYTRLFSRRNNSLKNIIGRNREYVAQKSPATTAAANEALTVSRAASTAAEHFRAHSSAAASMSDSMAPQTVKLGLQTREDGNRGCEILSRRYKDENGGRGEGGGERRGHRGAMIENMGRRRTNPSLDGERSNGTADGVNGREDEDRRQGQEEKSTAANGYQPGLMPNLQLVDDYDAQYFNCCVQEPKDLKSAKDVAKYTKIS